MPQQMGTRYWWRQERTSRTLTSCTGNVITGNTACGSGAGIAVEFSSAVIQGNTITNNSQQGCDGGPGGGGIFIGGAGSAQVIGNIVTNNTEQADGGGIGLDAAGTPTIANNFMYGNTAFWGRATELVL